MYLRDVNRSFVCLINKNLIDYQVWLWHYSWTRAFKEKTFSNSGVFFWKKKKKKKHNALGSCNLQCPILSYILQHKAMQRYSESFKLSPEQEAVEIYQHGPVWVLFAQLEV